MAITVSGTTGVAGVDGSASAPATTGTDSNSGVSYGADEVRISTGGSERLRLASAGQVGVAGANYGTDGQVLTSTGASSAPAWETISTGTATLKAWAAFDGDGDVNATLTGGNITSLTDHSTGNYTITFDTDFADDNYMMNGNQTTQGFVGFYTEGTILTGSCRIGTLNDAGSYINPFRVSVGFWR